MKKEKDSKEFLKTFGISMAMVAVGFYAAYQFVGPAPTKNIRIATGGKGGAYYQFGQQYAEQFIKDRVELTVLETAGSVDNLSQLMADDGNVHAALIQGGIGTPEEFPILQSLGSMYYEPLWLFHSNRIQVKTLGDLKHRRVVLGSQGSGTYVLTALLLSENGVTPDTAQFLEINGKAGMEALLSGTADALFLVAGTDSSDVVRLIENSDVRLYSFDRADAYTSIYKYLSKVTLPEGSVDLHRNIPNRDVTLVAPAANLIIRNDLHPALMYLFLIAADEVHGEGGLLEGRGDFPSPRAVGFPLNKEAKRFYQSGPPFLMRILPFQMATWLVRMFVMVIPLATILYPLIKIAPPTYRWRVRRKVNKAYKKLHRLEEDLALSPDRENIEKLKRKLNDLEHKAASLHVPASCLESQYILRRHIELVRERLESTR